VDPTIVITIGAIGLPTFLSSVLDLLFSWLAVGYGDNVANIPNRVKKTAGILCGMALSLLGLYSMSLIPNPVVTITPQNILAFLSVGYSLGLSASGAKQLGKGEDDFMPRARQGQNVKGA
jgi:hypothetical protein